MIECPSCNTEYFIQPQNEEIKDEETIEDEEPLTDEFDEGNL